MPKSDEPIFEQLALDINLEGCYDADYTVPGEELTPPEPEVNPAAQQIIDELKNLDVTSMTIMNAANKLYELVEILKRR